MRCEIRQTSRPERTRSLANRDLDAGHIDFAAQAAINFLCGGGFEEQTQRFSQIVARFGHGVSLAGDIHFRHKARYPSPSRSAIAVNCLFMPHLPFRIQLVFHLLRTMAGMF